MHGSDGLLRQQFLARAEACSHSSSNPGWGRDTDTGTDA